MIIRKEYFIRDMMCANCVMHLEGIEDEIPGIISAKANLGKQKLMIEFDEDQVVEDEIIQAIKQKGYTPV